MDAKEGKTGKQRKRKRPGERERKKGGWGGGPAGVRKQTNAGGRECFMEPPLVVFCPGGRQR